MSMDMFWPMVALAAAWFSNDRVAAT